MLPRVGGREAQHEQESFSSQRPDDVPSRQPGPATTPACGRASASARGPSRELHRDEHRGQRPRLLREAIEEANAIPGADIITFALSGTITLVSALPLITDPAGLSIDGRDQSVTVSGNDAVRPFQTAAGALMGAAPPYGYGGPRDYGRGHPQQRRNTNHREQHNQAATSRRFGSGGGGLVNESGTVTISNSAITGNGTLYAGSGGGIINKGTLTISNSRISGNGTFTFGGSQGGGIVNEGMLTITDSTISDNRAIGDSAGGGSHTTGGGIMTAESSSS